MLDDFTRTQIKNIATNDPICIQALINSVTENQNASDCSLKAVIATDQHTQISSPESCTVQQLQHDFSAKKAEQELEQKKIISGLIRQKFVNTVINIPNKTTKSIIEWYMMIPSDTFLKYVEWYKENGYSF